MQTILILVNLETTIYNFRREVVDGLLQAGYRVILGLPKGERWQHFLDMGCELIEIPVDRRGINPIKDVLLLYRYIKTLDDIKPDIVLTYTIKPNVYGGVVAHLLKIPFVMTVTGLGTAFQKKGLLSSILTFGLTFLIKRSSHTFFQNGDISSFFLQRLKGTMNTSTIKGSGVNLIKFPYVAYPPEEKENKNIFLYVGRIMKEKGVPEIMEAAPLIIQDHPNTEFHFVGRYEKNYFVQVKKWEQQKGVFFHGEHKNVQPFYVKAHCLIHPTYYPEGMSNVCLEAAATGRPVIASRIAGCHETFDEGITGFGTATQDVTTLKETINKFLNLSYANKKQMGLEGRKKIEKEFNREEIVDIYIRTIKEILERREL